MTLFEDRKNFLKGVQDLIESLALLGLSIEGSRNTNDFTAFEIDVAAEEGIEEKLKDLVDFNELSFDGFIKPKEDTYTLTYCQKSKEILLKEDLQKHLEAEGFVVISVGETTPLADLIFNVSLEDVAILKTLENYKDLIFDGYTARGDSYDLVYVYPKED